MSTLSEAGRTERVATKHLWWVTGVALVTAVGGNLLLYIIGRAFLGDGLAAILPDATEPLPLPLVLVIATTAVPTLLGTGTLLFLRRFTRPLTLFRLLSGFILLLSLVPVWTMPPIISVGAKITLSLMHVWAAGAIAAILTTFGRTR